MATRKRTSKSTKQEPKQEPKQERNGQIKAMDFVPVWQRCHSAEEVAEEFGRDAMWAASFASRLRSKGVSLKKMKRRGGGGKSLDVDELNNLAAESLVDDDD